MKNQGKKNFETPIFDEGRLVVSEHHAIYYSQAGNPHGLPVVYVHGGPGSQSKSSHRNFFDPDQYRIILFDQRGCGRSLPSGEINDNSTVNLLDDIEKLRDHLSVEKWTMFGSSWGSTLALLYASYYPERIKHLVVHGVFLARSEDSDWLISSQDSLKEQRLELWKSREAALKDLKINLNNSILSQLFELFEQGSLNIKQQVTAAIINWEYPLGTIYWRKIRPINWQEVNEQMIAGTRIMLHYAVNRFFLEEGEVLRRAGKLTNLSMTIIHGKEDLVCSVNQAYLLAQACPRAKLHTLDGAGHSKEDPGMIDLIKTIFADLSSTLSNLI